MNELTRAPINAAIWGGLGFLWWPFWLMLAVLLLRTVMLTEVR